MTITDVLILINMAFLAIAYLALRLKIESIKDKPLGLQGIIQNCADSCPSPPQRDKPETNELEWELLKRHDADIEKIKLQADKALWAATNAPQFTEGDVVKVLEKDEEGKLGNSRGRYLITLRIIEEDYYDERVEFCWNYQATKIGEGKERTAWAGDFIFEKLEI